MVRIKRTDESFLEVDLSVPLMCDQIRVISDHWSWSGLSQWNAPSSFWGCHWRKAVLLPERNGRIFSAWDSSSNNACLASLLWKTRWFHHRRYTSWIILYNKVKTFTIKFDSPYTYQRALDSRTRTTTNTKFLSVLSSARVWASVILAGKRDNRRHSATSLSENGRENVVVAGAGYQMWDVLSFCYRERA